MQLNMDIVIYLLGLAVTWGTVLSKISALEKKVDKHNSMVERTYKLEGEMLAGTDKIKVVNHRLSDLEAVLERRGKQ